MDNELLGLACFCPPDIKFIGTDRHAGDLELGLQDCRASALTHWAVYSTSILDFCMSPKSPALLRYCSVVKHVTFSISYSSEGSVSNYNSSCLTVWVRFPCQVSYVKASAFQDFLILDLWLGLWSHTSYCLRLFPYFMKSPRNWYYYYSQYRQKKMEAQRHKATWQRQNGSSVAELGFSPEVNNFQS